MWPRVLGEVFLGDRLLPFLVLALGAAMVLGNGAALLRPPPRPKAGQLTRAPMIRTVTMMGIGLIASVWALASLVAR